MLLEVAVERAGSDAEPTRRAGPQRGGAREDRRPATPSGSRCRSTASRSRPTRPTGSSSPRRPVDRLHPLGPRADRGADPPGAAAHPGVAPHAVRPLARARARPRSCASTVGGRPSGRRWRSTAASSASCGPGDAHRRARRRPHRRPARHLRAARLPPDPEGQVRAERPLRARVVLTELAVADLGVIAELASCSARA